MTVDANPAEGLHGYRLPPTRDPLSLGRVRALLVGASQVQGEPTPARVALALRDRGCLELLFATGMRASETVATRVVDVDLADASVLVRRAKRGHSRRLPLPPSAVEGLRRYLEEGRPTLVSKDQDEGGRLFLGARGRPLRPCGLHGLVRRVSLRCGAATFPHAFRRTLATELARLGASLPVIQEVLGHANLTMTASYVQVGVVEMREALDLLDQQRPKCSEGPSLGLDLQSRLFLGWQYEAASGSNAESAHAHYTGRSRRIA